MSVPGIRNGAIHPIQKISSSVLGQPKLVAAGDAVLEGTAAKTFSSSVDTLLDQSELLSWFEHS